MALPAAGVKARAGREARPMPGTRGLPHGCSNRLAAHHVVLPGARAAGTRTFARQ